MECCDGDEASVRWSELPARALEKTLSLLCASDVVSAGQTCRSWRAAAKEPGVWQERDLAYSTVYELMVFMDWPLSNGLRHRDARTFVRVVRFAPCLHWLKTAEVMLPAARKALTNSNIKLFGIEVNGRLAWPAKLLSQKEEGLQEVTLVNPNMGCLLAALRCRDLRSLKMKFCQDKKYTCPVLSKDVRIERQNPLKGLVCDGGAFPEAVSSLMERFGDTLEEVYVSCLPSSAALARCTGLRSLGVNLAPASPEDREQLLAGLHGKQLDFIVFKAVKDWDRHPKEGCKAFRQQLQKFVRSDVRCKMCA
ncbi:uncharacterized protein LOC117644961 isoform X2 [Thrips palmi]|uniref:Uncharacterized protein LOC117644961 isoform X2 n=1 Tax=Thrips palmi TaxID=161013 RepID=A0A6P8YU98_THRPL|nr:uncharacterized protein LOC117644961 isoform X2 [Thrips palmi]